MLKVVGASWEQTRVTKFLLSIVIIIAIFAIFFYEATPSKDDGCYTAVAHWSKQGGVRIEFLGQNNNPFDVKQDAARAYYQPNYTKTGWTSLEIETNSQYSDYVQAKSAGMLEGSLCWQLIFWHWQNTIGNFCEQKEELCSEIKNILLENYNTVKPLAEKLERSDAYWHQVSLFYTQIEGLVEGWELGVKRSRRQVPTELTLADFLWLNHRDDVRDLELKLVNESYFYNPFHLPSDLAVVRHMKRFKSTFLVAHQSAGLYSEMLRVTKKYSFSYRKTKFTSSGEIPGSLAIFTSYPGAIHSQDDFYQIRGRSELVVLSSRLVNHNIFTWAHSDDKVVLMGVRATVANRLASTGEQWVRLMSRYNSGTGNKLWLVLDVLHHQNKLWSLEQYPGKTNFIDLTSEWREKGYWIGSGIPYTKAAKDALGLQNTTGGKNMVSFMEPIRSFLENNMKDVENTDELYSLLINREIVKRARGDLTAASFPSKVEKSNETEAAAGFFQKSPLQGKTISSTTPLPEEDYRERRNSPSLGGIIDTKLTNTIHNFKAIAGPLYTADPADISPFQWSETETANCHIGQPNVWDFCRMIPHWVWWKSPDSPMVIDHQ